MSEHLEYSAAPQCDLSLPMTLLKRNNPLIQKIEKKERREMYMERRVREFNFPPKFCKAKIRYGVFCAIFEKLGKEFLKKAFAKQKAHPLNCEKL